MNRDLAMKQAFIAVIALGLAGCSAKQEPARVESAPAAPVSVSTAVAAMQKLAGGFEAVGTVRARTSTEVAARMMGYVNQVNVKLGDAVTKGQVLVVLSAPDVESQIRQAEAAAQEARSAQPEVEAAVNAAKAQLDLAQATFARMQDLLNKKSISAQEFDEASAKRRMADANHAMAQAKRGQLQAKIEQAEHAIRSAQITQGYATITAPASGVVSSKSVEPGALVTPGVPLLTIEQSGGLRLEASVEESHLGSVRVGQSVAVEIEGSKAMTGRVAELVPTVDPATRTLTVKIDLPASQQVRSGQFGRARFAMGEREALAVPQNAVITQGQLQRVFVVDEGFARVRMVTTGAAGPGGVEILSGLSPGETIVSPAPADLRDGARVEVRR